MTQGRDHLVDVAGAEGLREERPRVFNELLDGEFGVGVLDAGRYDEQLALTVGGARPAAGEEVGVELARDLLERNLGRCTGT